MKYIFLMILLAGCATNNDCRCSGDGEAYLPSEDKCVLVFYPYCTAEYAPVCGCNEESYPNKCFAHINGVKKYTPGECK